MRRCSQPERAGDRGERRCHVSATSARPVVFEGRIKDESRHLTLEPAPARGSQSGGARGPSERADSAAPALARGVPSDCWEAPESARFARFEPELQIAPGLAMSSSGLQWYSFLERTMRAVEPPPPPQAPFEPSLEPRASPPSRRATISRQRSLLEARFQKALLDWQNDVFVARGNASSHTDSRPQMNLGSKFINSRIPV